MLWLLRHGEAADGRPDEARPLTDRGLQEAQAAGLALSRLKIKIDCCLTSPKRRAHQTAQIACAALGVDVTIEPALARSEYNPELLAIGLGDVLIVAHNPAISAAVRSLSGARVHMRPGGLAGIERGELISLTTPAQLSAIATDASVPV